MAYDGIIRPNVAEQMSRLSRKRREFRFRPQYFFFFLPFVPFPRRFFTFHNDYVMNKEVTCIIIARHVFLSLAKLPEDKSRIGARHTLQEKK